MLHRDLSSQNILLTSDNHIKIADFGCARKVNERGEYKSTSITGSPAYMAPEQLEGHVMTLKADMWAVGVNLWEVRAHTALRASWLKQLVIDVNCLYALCAACDAEIAVG